MSVQIDDRIFELFPFFFLALLALLAFLKYRKHSYSYLICVFVFGVYMLYALDKVFFPIAVSGMMADSWRENVNWSGHINVIPFPFSEPASTLPIEVRAYYRTLMFNVLLTVPFGFGINFIKRVSVKHIPLLAIGVGLAFESGQLLISLLLGYPYRVIDINDVLMNALGVLIGYGVFRLFGWLYMWITEQLDIQHVGLGAYIHDVVASSRRSTSTRV